MTTTAGVGVLLRLIARRERIRTPAAVVVCVGLLAITGASIASLYSKQADRVALQQQSRSTAAFRLLLGPLDTIDSTAGIASWRIGLFLMVVVGVVVALTVTRNLRAPEQAGQTELLRAGAVGRCAPLYAAVIWAAGTAAIIAAGVGVVTAALGAPGAAAAAVTGQYLIVGLGAVGLATMSNELLVGARDASLAAVGVIVGGYVLRGLGDMESGMSWLRWVSPVGWAQAVQPFTERRALPMVLAAALMVIGMLVAARVSARRDLGQGAFPTRPGPAGSTVLRSYPVFAVRSVGRQMAPWVGGAFAYAILLGTVLGSATDLIDDSGPLADVIKRLGGADTIVNALVGTVLGIIAILAGVAALIVMLRSRSDENAGRTELILSTAVSRRRHLLTSAALAAGACTLILLAAGVGIVFGHTLSPGSADIATSSVLVRAVAQVPGTLVIAALAVAFYAHSARAVGWMWVVVIADTVVGQLGSVLQLPQWVRDIAPHSHIRPDGTIDTLAVVVLLVVAVVVVVVADHRFARRDIPG
ncbi:ABC transporter permease [Williamsia sp. CHRR-6]|uniref:ABC transporter permease n=1 Tax=Williamsia sp. CHRR-6 TaxID=2835871 RepID=UPI001BD9C945|nr:hypothetical protein [Williamsia sp. CHRR-6]MBT0566424.1 hypothetical protein [Williamsia sp. CHRR-6]